jgi:hypothetical protein
LGAPTILFIDEIGKAKFKDFSVDDNLKWALHVLWFPCILQKWSKMFYVIIYGTRYQEYEMYKCICYILQAS